MMDKDFDFALDLPQGEKVTPPSYAHYRKEAERGDILAKFFLGQCYEKGQEAEQDYLKAAELYMSVSVSDDERYSGDPGDPLWPQYDAQYRLGFFYEKGLLPDATPQKAEEWYDRAAHSGSAEACFKMAELYIDGRGGEQNDHKVAKYLCLAISANCIDERFFALAKRLSEKAEASVPWGVLDALAECYEKGIGTKTDPTKAKECREKAVLLREKQDLKIQKQLKKLLLS